MTKRVTQFAGLSALALAVAAPAFADIKVNDNLAFSGYVVGLADSTSLDESENVSSMDLQATKLAAKFNFAPVSGTVSFFAGADNDPVVLDAFFSYDLGGGTSVTGGKFLSWLGYEAFDPVNMVTLTYAWATPGLGAFPGIPGYHTGVKLETGSDTFGAGIAVVDSNESNYFTDVAKGDGDLDNGAGFEAFLTFKTSALTVFLGGAYNSVEDDGGDYYSISDSYKSYSVDLWAQYVVGAVTFAGEFAIYNASFDTAGVEDLDTYFWGVWARYAATDKIAYTGRIAGGEADSGLAMKPSYMSFTFAPAFAVSSNLEIVAEGTYTKYDDAGANIDASTYFGVQARFKF